MKSNDTLLAHLVATDEMTREEVSKYKKDELVYRPSNIEVAPNEIVFIHFFNCKDPNFKIEITTPTTLLHLHQDNTLNGSNNSIIKAIGNVNFKSEGNPNFYVQYLRILY